MFSESLFTLALGAVVCVVSVLAGPLNSLLNAKGLRVHFTAVNLAEKMITVFALLVIFFLNYLSIRNALVCMLIGGVCGFFIRLKILSGSVSSEHLIMPSFDHILSRSETNLKMLRYGAPFMLWGFFAWMQSSAERWIFPFAGSLEDLGRYSVVLLLIANSSLLISNSLQTVVTPKVFEFERGREVRLTRDRFIQTLITANMAIAASFAVILGFFGNDVISIVITPDFHFPEVAIAALFISTGLFQVGQSLALRGLAANKPHIYLIPKVCSGVVFLLSCYLGMSFSGLLGLCVGHLLGNLFYALIVQVWNCRKLGKYVGRLVSD